MATRTISVTGGNYNDTAAWVEAAVPTAADDVVATAVSGNLTITAAAACRSIDLTNYVGTLTHNAAVTLSIGDATAGAGNVALKFVAGMTYTLGNATTSAISFISTEPVVNHTVDFAGKTTGNVTYDRLVGTGASWKLTGTHNTGTTATVTLTRGTLDTNDQTCSWGLWNSSNSNTRTFDPGNSAIAITGTGTAWNVATVTNLTISANTATITFTGAGVTISSGTLDLNGASLVSSGSGTATAGSGTITCTNFTRTGTAVKTDALTLSGNIVCTGQFAGTGNSTTNRLLIQSNTLGTTRTITAASVSITNCDFMDITGAGAAAPFTGTSLGDCLGNSGITFTTPTTRYGVVAGNWSNTATWSASSGGSGGASVPLPQDTVRLDANSAAGTYTVDMPHYGKDLNCTGFSGTVQNAPDSTSLRVTSRMLYGSLTLSSVMGWAWSSANNGISFRGRGIHTITTAGITLVTRTNDSADISAVGGTYTLNDALTVGLVNNNTSLTLANGTFDANDFNVSIPLFFSSSNSNVRTLHRGSGTWTLTGTGTVWTCATSTNLTMTGTGTIAITDTGSSSKTFAGGGKEYNEIAVTMGGTGAVIFTGSNSFAKLRREGTGTKTINFTAGTTQTLTGGRDAFFSGTSGNLITVQSVTAGSAWNLSKSGILFSEWLSIKDSNATGGAEFYAGNSTNVSGNNGWKFTFPPYGPRTRGTRPHDETESSFDLPMKIGGRGSVTVPAAVASGDRVEAAFDAEGRQWSGVGAQAQDVFDHGRKSGINTPVLLSTSSVPAKRGVTVRAARDNAGRIFVGNYEGVTVDSADDTDGFELGAGEAVFVPVDNANKIWLIAEVADSKAFFEAV